MNMFLELWSALRRAGAMLLTGFPSPWRALRRVWIRHQFNKLPNEYKAFAEFGGVDPDSLIKRGLL